MGLCVCLLSPVQQGVCLALCTWWGGFDLGPHSAAPGGRDVLCGPSLRLSEVTLLPPLMVPSSQQLGGCGSAGLEWSPLHRVWTPSH